VSLKASAGIASTVGPREALSRVCCFLPVGAVFAQTDRGTITGTIADPAGAVIPGASIVAKNNQTGAVYQAASTATGSYTLAQLPAGVYQLSISVPGFKQFVRTGITVLVAQTLRIDVGLEVGNITETVTVNADAPLLRTESGELSHNVASNTMSGLPMLGFDSTIRNPYAATQLIPGTLYQDRTNLRVNGAPSNSQSVRVEGQDATGGFRQSQTALSQPSVEAVEEFAIQTSNYAAEFGQAGGGVFNVTMKSGTNRFRGSAYEYFSNEALNANQPYVNARPRSRKNDFGFTLGGPIRLPRIYNGRDKTFFFVSVEWYRTTTIYNNIPQLVPTLAYRNGDFRQALTGRVLAKDPLGRDIVEGTIYDPATERIVNGLRVRDPFSNNTIPKDRFDPVAVNIQAMIPLPTSSSVTNNYLHPWTSPNNRNIGFVNNTRLGKSAWAIFAQDTWKVTRKFTLDYGLRWDYQSYLREQCGRIASFSPTTPNPSAGGLPGAVIFEGNGPGRCNCDLASVYPYAFGPRLGAAYQITRKTVLRAGWGISYGQTAAENHVSMNIGSKNPFSSPTYGEPGIIWKNGPPTPVAWPNFDPGQFPTSGTLTPPTIAIDRSAGRPPRMIQWSISLQHEIFKNLAVEAAYVGNRGAWWQANALINVNALTPERIASFGLDVSKAADQTLLNSQLSSPIAAQRGFNKPPYANFPMTSTVVQALRPFPQFANATSSSTPAISYLWAPLGRTWYDSLQLKVTKRFSHGLDFTSTFTWQKELTMGAEDSDTQGITATVNDVFNRPMNKYISGLSRPFVFVTAANYRLPKLGLNRAMSWAIRDWTLGAVLQYSSGVPIRSPIAQNRLSTLLFRDTFANRVPGEPLFTKDINCNSCFDPNKDFVLNPKAWVDPPAGQFGTSAGYYNDYRTRRRPSEALSIGRVFRIKERVALSIRADFQNILNRAQMNNPTSTNAKATQTVDSATGQTISGFGYINTGTVASAPRQGIIVARIQF
jgi:hypothetical protein